MVDLATADKPTLKTCRHEIRMIFQDPVVSLNPRMTVAQIIGEPLLVNGIAKGAELDDRVAELMRQVGLEPAWRERYPHAFSGGQRQRIGIARAIALEPRLIVADEPTSALDVSLRAQMLDLMIRLQDQLGLAYILISHDMGVIRYMCDRVAVMFRGRVVETGSTDQVTRDPQHDYTKALLVGDPASRPARPPHSWAFPVFRVVARNAGPVACCMERTAARSAGVSVMRVRPRPRTALPGLRCAPRKGADDQWRKEPPRELSVALVADERLGGGAWPKPRDKGRLGRLSDPTGRNVSEA